MTTSRTTKRVQHILQTGNVSTFGNVNFDKMGTMISGSHMVVGHSVSPAKVFMQPFTQLMAYGDRVDNTIENSSIFSIIRMCWLLAIKACGQ